LGEIEASLKQEVEMMTMKRASLEDEINEYKSQIVQYQIQIRQKDVEIDSS
jgi:hypothetical protein